MTVKSIGMSNRGGILDGEFREDEDVGGKKRCSLRRRRWWRGKRKKRSDRRVERTDGQNRVELESQSCVEDAFIDV